MGKGAIIGIFRAAGRAAAFENGITDVKIAAKCDGLFSTGLISGADVFALGVDHASVGLNFCWNTWRGQSAIGFRTERNEGKLAIV